MFSKYSSLSNKRILLVQGFIVSANEKCLPFGKFYFSRPKYEKKTKLYIEKGRLRYFHNIRFNSDFRLNIAWYTNCRGLDNLF